MITNEFNKSKTFRFKDEIDYASGSVVSKIILKKETGNVTLFSFDKGQNLSEHTAPFDAMIQVIEGQAEIIINRQAYILKEGESIIMPADIPHAVNAIEKFKMVLTMIKSK
ncbi:MAG: Cupin domain protein [Bacteroidetes bacterium ADurb.Bin408]|nr:MAG: Cupin domain protein [Bacteroidetes bacterium ADurb.Bin408]